MSNIVLAAGGDDGYQISRSVRLRSSASAYLTRTLSVNSTSQTKMTWSGWVKRGNLGSALRNCVFYVGNAGATSTIIFAEFFNDSFRVLIDGGATVQLTTTQVFRDPAAWYHIVFAYDSTQATASNRMKLYVNGVQVTAFSSAAYPALNATINNVATTIQQFANVGSVLFDGYLAEQHFVDGEGLAASSFGEFDGATGVWKPKKYAGTYGTNGFYLNFADNSAATAAAIGKDYSGNGNNFTPNNISVTAGVTYDSMIDVPTPYADGGNGRGNYCVINPISLGTSGAPTITGGNLNVSTPTTGFGVCLGTIGVSSGKWYWEFTATSSSTNNYFVGISNGSASLTNYIGSDANGWGYFGNNGSKYNNGSASAYGASYTAGDVIGVALDLDGGTITFYKNNTSQGQAFSGLTGTIFPAYSDGSGTVGSVGSFNFGQLPFAYTPPTGFKALNTQNLPDSTIKKGNQYFDVVPYAGDATYPRTVGGLNFQPDLVWIKSRSTTYDHVLYDSVRGTGTGANLMSNQTYAEGGDSVYANLTAFTASGFTVGTVSSTNILNSLGNYVAWQWKKGATQGFDIVTYTGSLTASGSVAINHNLGVAPKLVISKSRNPNGADAGGWNVQVPVMGADKFLFLNTTQSLLDSVATGGGSRPVPTSTQFYTTWNSGSNVSGNNYVAYLFAEVEGFSKFGKYTGNGSADGPFVYCGFRPKFVMVKRTDSTGSWQMLDTSRDPFNVEYNLQQANAAGADTTGYNILDGLSNGFKLRHYLNMEVNTNGGTYIFAAFAENPFKNSLAR